MKSIDARITALAEAVERRRLIQEEPIDPLSASLFAFEAEMANLDKIGIAALAAATDEDGRQVLTLEQTQQMANNFKMDATERRKEHSIEEHGKVFSRRCRIR